MAAVAAAVSMKATQKAVAKVPIPPPPKLPPALPASKCVALPKGQWVNFCVTSVGDKITYYVDGAEVDIEKQVATNLLHSEGGNMTIGKNTDTPFALFNVMAFDRPLGKEDVKQIYGKSTPEASRLELHELVKETDPMMAMHGSSAHLFDSDIHSREETRIEFNKAKMEFNGTDNYVSFPDLDLGDDFSWSMNILIQDDDDE